MSISGLRSNRRLIIVLSLSSASFVSAQASTESIAVANNGPTALAMGEQLYVRRVGRRVAGA